MKNFGTIKNSLSNFLSENISKDKAGVKNMFRSYLKEVKSDKVLSTQFLIYKNIEDKRTNDIMEAYEFVNATIDSIKEFNKKNISESNNRIYNKFKDVISEDFNSELMISIDNLITLSSNSKNASKISESKKYIVNYIVNNKVSDTLSEGVVPNSMLYSVIAEKYNNKYESLSDNDKELIKRLINNKEDESKVFQDTLSEALTIVNSKLNTNDLAVKESLLNVKSNLLNRKYSESTFIKDVTKLIKLKNDLA